MLTIPPRPWNLVPLKNMSLSAAIVACVCVYAAFIVKLGINNNLYAVVALYIPTYLYLAWKWPHVALMLIFASAPMANEVAGGDGPKVSAAEVNFLLALPIFYAHLLARRQLPCIGPLLWPALLYLCVCLYATLPSLEDRAALLALGQMVVYMTLLVAFFASFVDQPQKLAIALYALVAVGAALGTVALILHAEYILGLHKNSLGGSLACALIVAVELWMAADRALLKGLLAIAVALIGGGLLMSLSRGGWLGAVAGLGTVFLLRRDFRLLVRIGLLLIPLTFVLWMSLPQESREYATSFEAKGQNNIQTRLDDYAFAWRCFESNPLFGIGVQLRKQSDATNVVLFSLAESGVIGLITFGLLYAAFFRAVWRMRSKVAPGDPLYSLYAVGSALLVARLAHGMVDHYWGRGPTFMAWASFGMFVAVFTAVQKREETRLMEVGMKIGRERKIERKAPYA